MKPTDGQLVAATLTGDVDAYGLLVERYQHAAYGLAYHLVGNFEEAEDLAQEALIQAFYHLPQLRDADKFGPWLRRIVTNMCTNWSKREGRRWARKESPDQVEVSAPDTYDAVLSRELAATLDEMLQQLDEPNRLAVTMYCIDGLSHREIGAFLNISADAVKMRLHRARQQLQHNMVELIAETLREHALTPSFAREVSRMTVHFGIAGNGHPGHPFPDDAATRLYVQLYPRGDLSEAAAAANVPMHRAEELLEVWTRLLVAETHNGEVLCKAPIMTAEDAEILETWGREFSRIAIEELERQLPALRALAQQVKGEAPEESALEAVVWWNGAMAVQFAPRGEFIPPYPRRADTGEYCLLGSTSERPRGDRPGGYGYSSPGFGDEQWRLALYTWAEVGHHPEIQEYMRVTDFPMPADPLGMKLMRILRGIYQQPRTRDELLTLIEEQAVTEYPSTEFAAHLVKFRFITKNEPHRLTIPVIDEGPAQALDKVLEELRTAVLPRYRAIDEQRQEAVSRCSFKDCLPADREFISFMSAASWLSLVFERGLVPLLPKEAYAERGVFLQRHFVGEYVPDEAV